MGRAISRLLSHLVVGLNNTYRGSRNWHSMSTESSRTHPTRLCTSPSHRSPVASDTSSTANNAAAENEQRQQQITHLLDQLDALAAADGAIERRSSVRLSYRRSGIKVAVHHPGGTSSVRQVVTRDLSTGGIGFIHSGYLYRGTRIDVLLPRHDRSGEDVIHGTVIECIHVKGAWHSIGVKFAEHISTRLYVDAEKGVSAAPQKLDPSRLIGRILHLDDVELEQRLLAHHLRMTKVEIVSCSSVAIAANLLKYEPVDLLVTDLTLTASGGLPAMEGMDVIDHLRGSGYKGPIGVVTAEKRSQVLTQLTAAGVLGVLSKPYTPAECLTTMSSWLQSCSNRAPLYSNLSATDDMAPLLERYVQYVHQLRASLVWTAREEDARKYREICHKLVGSGGSFGFPQLTKAASEAAEIIEEEPNSPRAREALKRLEETCGRLVAEPAPEPSVAA